MDLNVYSGCVCGNAVVDDVGDCPGEVIPNIPERLKVFLRLEVPRQDAEVPSLTGLYPAADWQEREAFDLLGVRFTGHPNLAKILTPDFLVGHPLRKDYEHQPDLYDGK